MTVEDQTFLPDSLRWTAVQLMTDLQALTPRLLTQVPPTTTQSTMRQLDLTNILKLLSNILIYTDVVSLWRT